jgi:hypothetical protein
MFLGEDQLQMVGSAEVTREASTLRFAVRKRTSRKPADDLREALVLYQKRPQRRKLVSLIRICGGRF